MNDYIFSGLKVLDVGTVVAGPVAATILADFGADVIKIEQPGEGDLLRVLSDIPTTPDADSNYFWQMDGRNKKDLTLNLKTPEGIEILHKLIADCDVYVTNQPFGVRRALKLSYNDIKPLNPSMIYASLSAFGEEGPERDSKGFDLLAYWARSGLMDLVRSPGCKPSQALPGMGDHPTAIALYASIVTALLNKERTGKGAMVHTSLLANGLWSAASIAAGALANGDMDAYRATNQVPAATGYVYATKDNRWLQLTMIRSEGQFLQFLDSIDQLHFIKDERFATPELWYENREQLSALIQNVLINREAAEWLAIFEAKMVPIELVATVDEAVRNEQLIINNMVVAPTDPDIDVPFIINHPIKISNLDQVGPKRAPELGEHTDEILQNLGYSHQQILALKDKGVT
ncbi:L-carnitine dehydratase/bile acid-inducible protein F [marine gamma proteobacterium HTCC2143]|uniref:L-carnitine dehydratase/bile acid-inducible protein F n=1 Tax=marine gamma proteobacterium HTCC2143 TaxID=247633 RepID=A0Y7R7_9GAMM|nr:L-carnitine dehydratase/bile acid-inducible protein F [marine gamma proteobacterium HTCC2143]